MTRGTDFNMCPPTGGLRNYRKGYEDGLNRGKAELAEILDKISAEIDEVYKNIECHYPYGLIEFKCRIDEVLEKHKGGNDE